MRKRIYIADDEENIRDIITGFLESEGYSVSAFDRGDALLHAFFSTPADLVILDIMMDGTNGLAVCARIREHSDVPILFVSAKDSATDRITGITLGGDDYMVKPFSPVELVARVKAIFRRIDMDRAPLNAMTPLRFGDLAIDPVTRTCLCHGAPMHLTPLEFSLMTYLLAHSDRAVSRDELLQNIWGFHTEVESRATDDLVKRLRKKMGESGVRIASVWGFGFKLEAAHV